ncbi:hypothetical protein BLNAU_2599 [Blattamonas nauphoetae]|uniref:Uncharacterized protein n=1 Tax=Blattamonas nauphoetae TaxID=2049346 RepID=A0ABQ9YF06_9EUKA|nr:hypothetical protein BLNAU_2599 [Blattamonas nauphoetae]
MSRSLHKRRLSLRQRILLVLISVATLFLSLIQLIIVIIAESTSFLSCFLLVLWMAISVFMFVLEIVLSRPNRNQCCFIANTSSLLFFLFCLLATLPFFGAMYPFMMAFFPSLETQHTQPLTFPVRGEPSVGSQTLSLIQAVLSIIIVVLSCVFFPAFFSNKYHPLPMASMPFGQYGALFSLLTTSLIVIFDPGVSKELHLTSFASFFKCSNSHPLSLIIRIVTPILLLLFVGCQIYSLVRRRRKTRRLIIIPILSTTLLCITVLAFILLSWITISLSVSSKNIFLSLYYISLIVLVVVTYVLGLIQANLTRKFSDQQSEDSNSIKSPHKSPRYPSISYLPKYSVTTQKTSRDKPKSTDHFSTNSDLQDWMNPETAISDEECIPLYLESEQKYDYLPPTQKLSTRQNSITITYH